MSKTQMKIRLSTLLTVILAGLLFVIVGTLTAAEKQPVQEDILIENES